MKRFRIVTVAEIRQALHLLRAEFAVGETLDPSDYLDLIHCLLALAVLEPRRTGPALAPHSGARLQCLRLPDRLARQFAYHSP
jgi:hypothetical protein